MDMRQVWTRASGSRLIVIAAIFVIALAASSPIYSAVSGGHIVGSASASPLAAAGGAAAKADCTTATAKQLVNEHHLNNFLLPNPVAQLLCGSFTGPGSEAMAVAIGAPTCWGRQRWAVFNFTGGAWQLVLDEVQWIFELKAIGADIRERSPVSRAGDPRCLPSGGSHARLWHWDGTKLVAGPWKRVTQGEPKARGFYSPSKNIYCGMSDNSTFRGVDCASYKPPQKATMDVAGRVTICRDRGTRNRCNIGNPGEGTPTLGYGRQITVGRFRCLSRQSGVRCTLIRSGTGFLINRAGVRRVGP
jgi:hypothetical protein